MEIKIIFEGNPNAIEQAELKCELKKTLERYGFYKGTKIIRHDSTDIDKKLVIVDIK